MRLEWAVREVGSREGTVKFQTVVRQEPGMNATGLVVPEAVVAALGDGKRPKVVVTINGHSYRSTVAVMGGESLLPLAAEHRAAAGVAAGQEIEVDLVLDTLPREVEVPEDFAEALAAAGVREVFDRLAFSHRKEHVRTITEAKSADTRARRILKAVQMLRPIG